jgi:DNA-binding LytR/AlgR family response regulator
MSKTIQCLIIDDEPMAREILENHLKKIDSVQVVSTCKNAIDAFNAISANKIDVIFLDINMPEISGLSFAKSINKKIKIIFTTAYREYAVDGFDLQAVDYLLKPISFDRLYQSINKYIDECIPTDLPKDDQIKIEQSDFIFVRSDRKMIKVNFSEICYIESLGDYIKIVLDTKNIITRETISSMEAKLPKKIFLRTHRSYLISIPQITSFTNEYIEINKKAIPISRSYKSSVLNRLKNL